MPECSFVLLTSPRDIEFLSPILRHLVRMCAFPFREVILVLDDLPRKIPEPRAGEFSRLVDELRKEGVFTRSVPLSGVPSKDLAKKYFGERISVERDHRGVPLFGWIAGLEAAQTDFVLHFDSDILLYQAAGHSWIDEGMALIEEDPQVMFVAPLPGPPARDGAVHGQAITPTLDLHGNLRFKTFSSRRFLVSKQRFATLLPTPLQYISANRRRIMHLGIGNALCPWEQCVSRALEDSLFYRVHLSSADAWALHCPDHGEAWVRALPDLIGKIELGQYPEQQAGRYDLMLPAWK
jgi:hypothetical protein